MIHRVYLALGSNLGNKTENIHEAIGKIDSRVGKVMAVSRMYETLPVGFVSENSFLNAACLAMTRLDATEILAVTQDIEREMGRLSKSEDHRYADRIIDIDLLFCDNLTVQTAELTLPHPQIHRRMFVLEPLAEIAPGLVHPTLKLTMVQLKQKLESER